MPRLHAMQGEVVVVVLVRRSAREGEGEIRGGLVSRERLATQEEETQKSQAQGTGTRHKAQEIGQAKRKRDRDRRQSTNQEWQ